MPNFATPGTKLALPLASGGSSIRALSLVWGSVCIANVPAVARPAILLGSYQPNGTNPAGEKRPSGRNVTGRVVSSRSNDGAETSSVPATTPGSIAPGLGLALSGSQLGNLVVHSGNARKI